MKGGPALHIEDQELLQQNSIDRESLITIRKGEPVISLEDRNRPEWIKAELIKLKGIHVRNGPVFFMTRMIALRVLSTKHRPLECVLC